MVQLSNQFPQALERLDAVHAEDPRREVVEGVAQPRELVYARRMSAWLERLIPNASEALQLAVRAQHLRRWSLPREDYPAGRAGYHAWRSELGRRQGAEAARILAELGYEPELCERVSALIRKENRREDLEAQALEDAACLVFLQYHFGEFAAGHDEARLIDIVRKTWRKMSPPAQELAGSLPLGQAELAVVQKALSGEV